MENPHSILKKFFGYDSFRPGQEQIVQRLLAGQGVQAVMPTGAGKSICYQVPALLLPGITLVVSPLVSLMKDQVGALVQAGVAAAFLNNSLTDNQKALMLHRAREGGYKIIYVAPERLEMPGFQRFAQEKLISMVTVDEAHCISQWGQDFRPSYLRIQAFVDSLPTRPVVGAFTATATAHVRADIREQLEKIENTKGVYEYKKTILDKNGIIGGLMKQMGSVPKEEKADFGKKVNELKNWASEHFAELNPKLKENEMEPVDIRFSPEHLSRLIALVDGKVINSSVAKEVFQVMFEEDVDPEQYVEEKGLKTVNDEGALRKGVEEVIAANPQSVEDYHNGKEKAIGFLVVQTMKAMKGKSNPALVNQILKELL